ncbi:mucin-17 [Drosophila subpulchrella]|uniref:mucin-17 n=1 Tax=Drosophila subpulchrella TaxID=1486046 RepID=UPI0018A1487F|nr:mucin-17 [Drosophila subpulchrella]
MIQEPARVQAAPSYEATTREDNNATSQDPAAGATNSWPNCSCSQRRTRPTEPMRDSPTSTVTTIPIVIDSKPNPRILLIRVPTSSSNNSNSNRSGTEHRTPRTRIIRIPFLPGSVPTRPPANQAAPATSPLVNPTDSARRSRISACPTTTGTPISRSQPETVAGSPTTTTAMVNNQTVPVSSSAPQTQTLAAMAGIQLTGADEPPSRRDMSGAMPTATVEEIDVPVFIDEYLQDIEATSSTCSSENGKEIFTETDILDFDINMFAEDNIEPEGKIMDLFSPTRGEMNNDNLDINFLQMDDLPLANEEETLDMTPMCGIDINQQQDLDLISIFPSSQPQSMLTGSQDPYLFSYSQATSTSSTTKYITEEPLIADMVSCDTISLFGCSQESLGFGPEEDVKPSGSFASSGGDVAVAIPTPIQLPIISTLKRSAPAPVVETQPLKRSKLALQINTHPAPASSPSTPEIIEHLLNFDRLEATNTSTSNTNTSISTIVITREDIVEDLRSAEEETTIDFSPPNTPHSNYSASSSCAAPTCQTGFGGFLTAPASPAYSVASTSLFSPSPAGGTNGKRKRGRPAKDHADGPDPNLLSRMNGEERKAYEDRLKNNEASRVSRRKTKKREEEEKSAEDELVAENLRLRALADDVASLERKYKKYLMDRQRKNSTYNVKQEQH